MSQDSDDVARSGTFLPALRFNALTRFYDPLIAATTRERAFRRRLVELAHVHDGERVLDIGCGTGTLAVEIACRTPGARITGVDADAAMLARARAKAAAAGVDVDLRAALAQAIPCADDSFDVAVSSLFFHHLNRPGKSAVAREVLRVLTPGGRLAIADWGAPGDPLMRVASLGIRLLDGAETTEDNHAGRLPALLRDAGFVDVAERGGLRTAFGVLAFVTATRAS